MCAIVLAGMVVCASSGRFGPAPKDTLDPPKCISRLITIFSNCGFSAVQAYQTAPAFGSAFTQTSKLRGKVCSNAIVIQGEIHQRSDAEDSTRWFERRWTRKEPSLTTDLAALPAADGRQARPNSVVAVPKGDGDLNTVWGNTLLREFSETNQSSAVTFLDMVTDGGRRGYSLRNVEWSSSDHSKIAYEFTSGNYGTATVEFSMVGDAWMPVELDVVRSANDKLDAREAPSRNYVKNYFPFTEFSKPTQGLDKLECVYEISYAGLPTSIKRTETRLFGHERSIVTTTLVFSSLRSGDISCDEVRDAMLHIPDDTPVLYGDDNLGKLAWVIKDGHIVKSIDQTAHNIGRRAAFFSNRRLWFIFAANFLVLLVALFLYGQRLWRRAGR